MSIHGNPTISYTFHDPYKNRYYITYVTGDDATRLQTDTQFATDVFYRIKSIQDVLQDAGVTSARPCARPSSNGQIHGLPNQRIVHLPSAGLSPRWFTYYPTPVQRFVYPRKKKHYIPFPTF
ncbi:uncharacterized protein LOC107038649 [Diachasma alloeum]|uniref:uncharacterized protein LOC107038649 n=1 Tax=Diachasma alloeum TaxID=454923 RepID=UPI000738412D|nr:uncharacterized protein LOC107038649 [Diachasma alloeum]